MRCAHNYVPNHEPNEQADCQHDYDLCVLDLPSAKRRAQHADNKAAKHCSFERLEPPMRSLSVLMVNQYKSEQHEARTGFRQSGHGYCPDHHGTLGALALAADILQPIDNVRISRLIVIGPYDVASVTGQWAVTRKAPGRDAKFPKQVGSFLLGLSWAVVYGNIHQACSLNLPQGLRPGSRAALDA
jgi:hypothetical protein